MLDRCNRRLSKRSLSPEEKAMTVKEVSACHTCANSSKLSHHVKWGEPTGSLQSPALACGLCCGSFGVSYAAYDRSIFIVIVAVQRSCSLSTCCCYCCELYGRAFC